MSARIPAASTQPDPATPPTEETLVQRPGTPLSVTPRPAELLTAPKRIGEYEAQKKLGEGGMGVVYQGWDTQLRRNVAIKVLLPRYSADREARERFLREARAAASIAHDNVVTIYHVGDHHGSAYLVMPLLKGQSLEAYLQRKGMPSVPQTLRIAREILAGLAAAHKQGLIHRDVKPANVWLESPHGRVKILDFGIAKPVASAAHTAVTDEGVVMGTPAFMSPEQARGHAVDPRSDLFSLGAVLYRMCAGMPPFVRPTAMDTLTALVSEDATPVESYNAALPPRLAALIHRLLNRDPAARAATADEAIKELRQIERDVANESPLSGVIAADAAVRVTVEAIAIVAPAADSGEFGFEIVEDEPVIVDRTHTTRKRRKKPPAVVNGSVVLGVVACVVGAIVGAVVIGQIVRSVGESSKPKEKVVPPLATVAPVVPPAIEEVKPPAEEPPPEPRFFDPEGRPFPPPPPRGFPPPPRRGFPPPPPHERP